jgi:CHASE3 domain sensor protein
VIRFKDLSMKTKIVVSLVPMIACSLLVSFHIYKTGLNEDTTLERAIAITDTVALQELEMVTMSEALRGYILEPKNAKEYERKKEADKLYGQYSEVLAGLTKENKETISTKQWPSSMKMNWIKKKQKLQRW